MSDRREFFRRAALIAAGIVGADQLDLLERLTHVRRLFPGWRPATLRQELDAVFADLHMEPVFVTLYPVITPLRSMPKPPRSLFDPPPAPTQWRATTFYMDPPAPSLRSPDFARILSR